MNWWAPGAARPSLRPSGAPTLDDTVVVAATNRLEPPLAGMGSVNVAVSVAGIAVADDVFADADTVNDAESVVAARFVEPRTFTAAAEIVIVSTTAATDAVDVDDTAPTLVEIEPNPAVRFVAPCADGASTVMDLATTVATDVAVRVNDTAPTLVLTCVASGAARPEAEMIAVPVSHDRDNVVGVALPDAVSDVAFAMTAIWFVAGAPIAAVVATDTDVVIVRANTVGSARPDAWTVAA